MSSEPRLQPDVIIVRNRYPLWAEIDGEVVLLSVDNDTYYDMNDIGSRIWALVEQPISIAALIDQLVGEFAVERAVCEDDVLAFLNELHVNGLVQIADERP